MKDLLEANIFSGFSPWKSIAYVGERTPKILKFEVTPVEGDSRFLYLVSIISKEEKMAWQSFQDVLEHTATLAQSGLRGFFGLDVLSVDIQAGIRNFNPNDLGRLIVNHARDLGPVPIPINRSAAEIGAVPTAINEKKIKGGADQKTLVRYGQLFALLHYRAPADWGKIEVKTHVEFFSQEPAASFSADVTEASVRQALTGGGAKKGKTGGQLDLFLKKLLDEGGREPRAIYLLHDLSVHPVWDPTHEIQQQRLRAWFEKETQIQNGVSPEIHLYHSATRTRLELGRYFKTLIPKPSQNTHR